MKKLIFILVICLTVNLYSQEVDYDLYIVIEKSSDVEVIESQNDTLKLQLFTLKNQIDTVTRSYSINKNGQLITNILAHSGNNLNAITLFYKNEMNKNSPFVINKEQINNVINYPKDFYSSDIKNIYEVLKNSKNIYLIEYEDTSGNLFTKKVELKPKLSPL